MNRNTTTRDKHRRIIAQDEPPCAICHNPINYDLKYPDPWSYVVDHIHPRTRGGPDTLDNKQPAHNKCNRDKWHNTPTPAGATFITERTW